MLAVVLADLEQWLQDEKYGAVATSADTLLRQPSLPALVRARALRYKGTALWRLNPGVFVAAAISAWTEALDVAHQDVVERAKVACLLAGAYSGDPVEAQRYAEMAQGLDLGNEEVRALVAAAWVNVGWAFHQTQRLTEAEAAYLRALDIGRGVGRPTVPSGLAELNLAYALLDAGGRVTEAAQWLDDAEPALDMTKFGAGYLDLRAEAARQGGDLVAAEQLAALAMEHPSATERTRAETELTQARILVDSGRQAEGKAAAHEAFTRGGLIGHAWLCDRVARFLHGVEEAGR